ncbi:chorismate--pyruvate lyase family protein [Alkalilimnicola sp. S0819]|uniref:chorismate--pyruvate lyase family protein n=1 Tax=Alkalilimnicola sp. S0819 TaxID=2613922 RepID=UPI0012621081|nr:chorismate lyase [Alkalilimnicola sp. S0819]KAB7624427.1 chorismate lyase [Alkalilimnicola sp. S0819]MPQ16258.1 chorismate lyase [Alkalilimnicola sp. S0819]
MRLRRRATLWRPRFDIVQQRIPPALKGWLDEPGSLTARLAARCGGPLDVTVLRARWGRALLDEAQQLGQPYGGLDWVREVTLGCRGVPWIYARSIIPRTSLRGRQRALLRLGARPLGSVLFGPADIRRGAVQIARLGPGDQLYEQARPHAGGAAERLWARRSVLRVAGRPLLVAEVFLPRLLEAIDSACPVGGD